MPFEHSKRASATKSGPGRYHKGGKPGNRVSKSRPMRAFAALMAAWAAKRITKHELRDKHGAYTLVGRGEVAGGDGIAETRRMWLGGISAQRGF